MGDVVTESIHAYPDIHAANRPEARAIIDASGVSWTYADLHNASQAAAETLKAHGVASGDRVLLVTENCSTAIAFLFGASRLGAWAVPVNARHVRGELDRIIAHAEPRVVVLMSDASPDAAAHARGLRAAPLTGPFGTVTIITPHPSNPAGEPDVAVMLYTTGTTGEPKGVMLTHSNLRFAGKTSAKVRTIGPEDSVYGVLPITHVFGLASMVMAATYAGATIRLELRFSAERLYQALEEGATILPAVPQMHALLMEYTRSKGFETLQTKALRYVSSGAAPLDPVWKRKAEAFYGIPLQNGYGMTETTAGIATTANEIGDPDISVGRPLPGVSVRVEEGIACSGIGEIHTKGPHVMKGYFRNPEETARVFTSDGWLCTGDLGRMDAEGRIHIVGRAKELIIRGGFNVFPPEVEAALNDHPLVIQSAVIGRKTNGDEEVLAFVQVANPETITEGELLSFLIERLTGYKRPSQIIIATALPAAPTGKILKHRLLEAFAEKL